METGDARLVYRHFIVIGQESVIAAMGSECAAEQDGFWEFHDALFDNWAGANSGAFLYDNLLGYAEDLGLDGALFDECMQSGRAFERVRTEHIDAEDQGINATPTVFVNGKRVSGDYDAFRQAIESELAAN